MGLLFFPRGGSSHVARQLASSLPATGWDVTIVSGSLSASRPARRRARVLPRPRRPPGRLHRGARRPRPAARRSAVPPVLRGPRRTRPTGSWPRSTMPATSTRSRAWAAALRGRRRGGGRRPAPAPPDAAQRGGGARRAGRARRRAPPRHRAADARGDRGSRRRGLAPRRGLGGAPARLGAALRAPHRPLGHAGRARGAAARHRPGALRARSRTASIPAAFQRRPLDRRAHWRRHLVDEPQGWAPGGEAGSVAYTEADLAAFDGRRARAALRRPLHRGQARRAADRGLHARPRALRRPGAARPARRLPGRVGGRAPARRRSARMGAEDVFLAGWHGHDELPAFLSAADAIVLPSVREQFGQVLVEGMACGLPAVAVDAFGPSEIVDDGETGWLVPPDDGDALADALLAVVERPGRAPPPRRAGAGSRSRALRLARAGGAGRRPLRRRRAQQRCTSRPDGPVRSPDTAHRIAAWAHDRPVAACYRSRTPVPKSRPSGATCCRHARARPSRSACTTPSTSTTLAASRSSRG